MKTRLFIITIVCFTSSFLFAQTAQNITFTDLDDVTHDLYSYLDSGYTVVIDFSYEQCYPCYNWSQHVGHDLWETYGINGDNTLRMFHFDVHPISDQDAANYTQGWGIEYPIINLPNQNYFPEYPEDGYPQIYVICPNKSYFETGGYGYPQSEVEDHYFLNMCQGADLDSNLTLFGIDELTSNSSICQTDPLIYTPILKIMVSSHFLNFETVFFEDSYEIKTFVNNQYHQTQTINPTLNGGVYSPLTPTLEPIEVNPGDSIMFICSYSADNFANDDTAHAVIPLDINTPSSSDSSLSLMANNLYFTIYNSEGQIIIEGNGSTDFELAVGQCYSISFLGSHIYGATLKDINNIEILSFQAGEYEGDETPRLYFNVTNNPVGIKDIQKPMCKLTDSYYLDVLGKQYQKDFNDLPKGIYVQVMHYENGVMTTKKYYK